MNAPSKSCIQISFVKADKAGYLLNTAEHLAAEVG